MTKNGKTDVVASSSTNVEIIAMVLGLKMLMFYRNFFAECGVTFKTQSTMFDDSQAGLFNHG